MVDDVGGDECLLSVGLFGKVSSKAVEIYAQNRGFLGQVVLGQQGEDHAGEHIAASRRGHAWIACGVEEDAAIGKGNGGVGTFQHDDDLVPHGHGSLKFESFEAVGGFTEKALKLFRVRGQNGFGGEELQPGLVVGQDVERVGV